MEMGPFSIAEPHVNFAKVCMYDIMGFAKCKVFGNGVSGQKGWEALE